VVPAELEDDNGFISVQLKTERWT